MGIYDRDYYRQERPGFSLGLPQSAVVILIIANVAVYLIDGLLAGNDHKHWVADTLLLRAGSLTQPWMWWQFLTYGFVHDYHGLSHIIFNMLGLWFFGREIEALYGRAEFLRLYLVLVVVGGVVWAVVNDLILHSPGAEVMGASGAVTGVVILFALNFPRRTILFMFVLPMPAWVMGVLFVACDILGATGHSSQKDVAFSVHLAGAAFAALYYQWHWNFGKLLRGGFARPWFSSRTRLRLHQPGQETEAAEREVREKEVDRILEKIHREGESSLTRKERRILESASREYQQRRREN